MAITSSLVDEGYYNFTVDDSQQNNFQPGFVNNPKIRDLLNKLQSLRNKKTKLKCTECGEEGHNIQKCNACLEKEIGYCPNKEITPGPYICRYIQEDLLDNNIPERNPEPCNHTHGIIRSSVLCNTFVYTTIQNLENSNNIKREDSIHNTQGIAWFFEDEIEDPSLKLIIKTSEPTSQLTNDGDDQGNNNIINNCQSNNNNNVQNQNNNSKDVQPINNNHDDHENNTRMTKGKKTMLLKLTHH